MDCAQLDTDTVSEILKQRNQNVVRRASEYLSQHGVFIFSELTWFEILRGLQEKNAQKQIEKFEVFAAHSEIKAVDTAVLRRAALLWAEARKSGYPHNDADLIIAATALVHDLTLVTGNAKHFEWITGLKIDDWRLPSERVDTPS